MMVHNPRNVMKAHCDSIGMALRFLFWGYAVYVAAVAGFGIWMVFQDSACFSVYTAETGNGLLGFAFLNDSFEVDFSRNILSADAAAHPKLAYTVGFFGGFVIAVLTLAILWYIRRIFRSIDADETPFLQANTKAIFRIGVIMIAISLVKSCVMPLVCVACGIGAGGTSLVNINSLLIGAIVICLSYIFEYGTVLQREADETI